MEAVVFPSLEAIEHHFSIFFELLSKQNYSNRLYNSIFDEIHHKRILLTHELIAPLEESDIKISQKSEIAFDLDDVFSSFFARLIGDDDEDLLIECFVETRESRIADFTLEKMTTSVLGNIVPSEKNVDTELARLIETNVEIGSSTSDSGQTVFIVGPTGAGKSTFVERFFRKTLPRPIRRRCVLVRVNCLDATGREDTALDWLTERLISELENEVYKDGAPNWDDLLALYHSEYKRRAEGVDAKLYGRDKQAFKEKFGDFLDDRVENDREGHLKRMLKDVVNNRKSLPVILIDNTDEFSNEYKQKVFQFAQAIRRHTNHCLVIFPVTDKSAWSFSKTDIYGIYKSKSFFLPTPSPREVFRKRIDFLKQKLSEDRLDKKKRGEYFLGRGIKLSIEDLSGFAQVLKNVFVDNDYTSKTIGELTNYNIRRTLLLSQRVITSSVIKIEDLIKSYLNSDFISTNFTSFMEALMKGDYEAYKQRDNPEIYPVFQVDTDIQQTPLMLVRILVLLDAIHNGSRSIDDKHIEVQSIIDYFDAIGCTESAIDKALIAMLDAGLIEPYDVSNRDISNDQKLAISYRGKAHLRLASHNSVFFYQMALTTAISDKDAALKIKSIYKSTMPLHNKVLEIKIIFLEYLLNEDKKYISIGCQHDQYKCQVGLMSDLDMHRGNVVDDLVATLGDEYKEGVFKKGIVAIVDFFDGSKGFGFVEVEGVDSRIFIHAKKLQEHKINILNDGDGILCDLARGPKGIYIDKIYDIETDANNIETVECQIIRLFRDRGYGFIKVKGIARTAFFHITVFKQNVREEIKEGYHLVAHICPDKKGGYLIKQIVSVSECEENLDKTIMKK